MSGKYKQRWFYEAMAHLPYKAFCYLPEHHVSLCNPTSSCLGHLRILDANVVVTCATSKEQALSEAWRLFPTAISFNEPIREEQVREELIMRRVGAPSLPGFEQLFRADITVAQCLKEKGGN